MRKYFSAITIAIVLCFAATLVAEAGQARQPIKIYRTLYRTSYFLFWETTKKSNLLIKIYDKDNNGEYDSYLWYEDGQALHQGEFFTSMASDELQQKLNNESKNGFNAYFRKGSEEYSFKIPSNLSSTINGIISTSSDFNTAMRFEFVNDNFTAEEEYIPFDPPADSYNYRIDFTRTVKRASNNNNDQSKSEFHRILILDEDKDGDFDNFYYFIDDDLLYYGPFKTKLSKEILLKRLHEETAKNGSTIIEEYSNRIRIPVDSKKDGKSFGYFEVNLNGDYSLVYTDNPSFANPYVSIAEKLGVSIYPNPCRDYLTLVTGGLINSQATIDLYRNNIFISNFFSGFVQSDKMIFDISSYPNGAYQLIITSDNEIIFPLQFIINR